MKKLQTVLAVLLCLSLMACSQQATSSQGGGEMISGGGSPTEPPSSEPSNGPSNAVLEESDSAQSDGQAILTDIPQEEQESYIKKYLRPYYIVGLLDTSWSDPEEIELWQYMDFYIYNESDNYWRENPISEGYSIPWYTVEDYITGYFDVSPGYLRSAENYDGATACYRRMMTEGIGDGPGVTIQRVEIDGDLWKFVCRDISDNLLSVTVRMLDDGGFHYIAGEVLERVQPPQTEELFDPMALGEHANALTEHIVTSIFYAGDIKTGSCPPPEEKDMLWFTIGTVYYMDREEYGYHNVAYQDADLFFHFSEQGIRNMVFEVFGFENWTPDKNIMGQSDYRGDYDHPLAYNAEKKDFSGGLEFGFGNGMECKFMATVIDTQNMKVILDYDLYTSSLFPNPHKVASLSTDYSILLRDDGTPFLRYDHTSVQSVQQ